MRIRIQRSMVLVITVTLLISYAVATLAVYRQTLRIVEDEIKQEADYICAAIEISGDHYLAEMDYVRKSTRVTLITPEGSVLYDSLGGQTTFDDHSSRPEVRSALINGTGEHFRRSRSSGTEMFYYANRMSDGNILRVSKPIASAYQMALEILPVMIIMAVFMLIFAWFFSGWQAKRLVKPVNELDLEQPLQNSVYEELKPLLKRIDQQNREKDAIAMMRKEFSANVSHELKTPLTSVSGYAELLREGLVREKDIPVFADHIYKEAQRLLRLIEDIIRLSRLDEQNLGTARERVELLGLARETASLLAAEAEKTEIDVSVSGTETSVLGIRHVLEEILFNICENAIKYNRPGGSVRILVGVEDGRPFVSVADTGIGISPEDQERIFERFYRVDKSHSRKSGGTGLGLSIVKHGALVHGASIEMDSTPGSGTTMRILFPPEPDCPPATENAG